MMDVCQHVANVNGLRLSVCLAASSLTVAFLDRFSPKIGTDVRTPKSKSEFVGGQYHTTPSPVLPQKFSVQAKRS